MAVAVLPSVGQTSNSSSAELPLRLPQCEDRSAVLCWEITAVSVSDLPSASSITAPLHHTGISFHTPAPSPEADYYCVLLGVRLILGRGEL